MAEGEIDAGHVLSSVFHLSDIYGNVLDNIETNATTSSPADSKQLQVQVSAVPLT